MSTIKPEHIVAQARTWLGTKYHHQGRLKKSRNGPGGVDCVGLVVGVVHELGIHDGNGNVLSLYDETNYSFYPEGERLVRSIEKHLRKVPYEEMQIGDVLLFKFHRDPQHIGLLTDYPTGGIGVIHCNSSAGKVVEHPLSKTWLRLLVDVYRFPPASLKR